MSQTSACWRWAWTAWVALLSVAAFAIAAHAAERENLEARVVILANRDDPDSLRIAKHYATVRAVPEENIVALPLPKQEEINWKEFVGTLWHPLLAELVRLKWVDATPMETIDPVGRKKHAPYGHRIAALVICRGVPLKIANDSALFQEVPPFTRRGEFRTNAGSVDGELSLLALPNYPINAFLPNPLFQNERPSAFDEGQVVKVARLDGPTVEDALRLVDRASAVERTGLLGRAYIDLSDRDALGNAWLEDAAAQLRRAGFDTDVDREPATMPITARCDAAAIYLGWYAGDLNGPFALPGFRFPPGAIALHIHSYSAATLRTDRQGWTAPLVARGVTATVGNVYEPYLQFTHQPNLLLRALLKGKTLADAAYFSLPVLSWQAILIGDPLYRPFARSLEQQLEKRSELPPLLAGYAVLRRVRELDAAEKRDEADALLKAAMRDSPGLAVGLAWARRLRDRNDLDGASAALGFTVHLKTVPPTEWALMREVAQIFETNGKPAHAVEVWQALLGVNSVPRDLRLLWLPEARRAALAAKDRAQVDAWEKQNDVLLAEVAAERR